MSNQYFENNEKLISNEKKISFYFKKTKLEFITDNGVFSKDGIDFGSSLLLKTIEINPSDKVLDVGCGYGTIGLTIAKINPDSLVEMVDVNDRAINLSIKNKELNNITNAEIFASYIYENITGKYDKVVSNPPIRAGKKVVHEIALDAVKHLNEGGSFWCVIQKKQGAPSLFKALLEHYQSVEVVEKDAGYWIIKAVKQSK